LVAIALALLPAGCGEEKDPANEKPTDRYQQIIDLAVGTDGKSGDIDDFWRRQFAELDKRYESPRGFHPYVPAKPPEIACDPGDWSGNAFYCPDDKTISWDRAWLRDGIFNSSLIDMAPLAVLSHEWGHHIQSLLGSGALSVQSELQADCYAGLYFDYAENSRKVNLKGGDVGEGAFTLFAGGDSDFHQGNWFEEGVHGDGPARRLAFARGWITADIDFCRAYDRYELQEPRQFGDSTLTLPPGESGTRELENGGVELQWDELTLQVQQGPTVTGDALEAFPDFAKSWFGNTAVTPVGDPERFDPVPAGTRAAGTSAALQRYEQTLTDESGQRTVHGALLLFVQKSGSSIAFDVFTEGPAPNDNAEWEKIGDLLFSSVFGLSDFDVAL
jgi:predicted metalloprotease